MSDDYLFDKTGADAELAALETALGDFAHRAPMRPLATAPVLPLRTTRTKWLVRGAIVGVLAAAAVVILVVTHTTPQAPSVVAANPCPQGVGGFAFQMAKGVATCGEMARTAGILPVGAWLETPRAAVGSVRVADIGDLTVYGDSKLRIVETSPTGHHLQLARGRISARVTAPPRLFVVDTPAAAAVDLGCAYDLLVDDDGHTHLRVTAGAVSLEARGTSVYVLAGHEVEGSPGHALGTPIVTDASPEYRALVARFDGGDRAALAAILAATQSHQILTLWNLVARTHGADRVAVVDALLTFVPFPAGTTREGVLALDVDALDSWRIAVAERWIATPF